MRGAWCAGKNYPDERGTVDARLSAASRVRSSTGLTEEAHPVE
jgi:hypothetical protein